jgi:hypothetical protein
MFALASRASQAPLRAYDPPMAETELDSPKLRRRVDRLYTLPLEEFTGTRNELAKELRAGGDREAADRVKALRKPSRSAWAINRLRQEDRAVLRSALKAGQQLRAAQSGALSGASGETLRERARAERRAVAEAAERAAQIEPGLTERDRERIRATLHAGAGDDEIRAEIESGRLASDHEPVGLGPLEGTPGGGAAPPLAKRPAPRERPRDDRRKLTQARGTERMARRALEAAERNLEKRRTAAVRAREELREAEHQLAGAQAAAEKASAERERAESG